MRIITFYLNFLFLRKFNSMTEKMEGNSSYKKGTDLVNTFSGDLSNEVSNRIH